MTATNEIQQAPIACVVLAAGKGSRMRGYEGNKTLLPLVPEGGLYQGSHPILLEVLANLPAGPRGIVVNHQSEAVRAATAHLQPRYLVQPTTNGTGGALLAARPFLEEAATAYSIVTMGDVPLVRATTYQAMLDQLADADLVVLAFEPEDPGQYGMLEMDQDRVLRIVEWKYWREFRPDRRRRLRYCNAGIYAARRGLFLEFVDRMARHPHRVDKQREGQWVTIEEYFLTDLVELMAQAGHRVGLQIAPEEEVTGVDTPEALRLVQERFALQKP